MSAPTPVTNYYFSDELDYSKRRDNEIRTDIPVDIVIPPRPKYSDNPALWNKWRYKYDPDYREKFRKTQKSWQEKNRKKHNGYTSKYQKKLKLEILTHYSNGSSPKCVCCSESILDFLTLDHIYGEGNKHRRKIRGGSGTTTYLWIKRNDFPKGFQVLCMNCNLSKEINKGKCIHQVLRENVSS